MSNVQLLELEASDLVDVLHHLFVQDNTYASEEAMKSRSAIRTAVYESLYGRTYKYKHHDKSKSRGSSPRIEDYPVDDMGYMPPEESVKPFDPKAEPPKPFVPPTDFNPDSALPFGNTLDAPLG